MVMNCKAKKEALQDLRQKIKTDMKKILINTDAGWSPLVIRALLAIVIFAHGAQKLLAGLEVLDSMDPCIISLKLLVFPGSLGLW